MIYLDNAATSFPKPSVVCEKMNDCMKNYCANPGRGGHSLSIKASKEVIKTRALVGEIFNISNIMNICFTKNATESLNIAIKGLLTAGDHVITTSMEHNSVVRPLRVLERDRNIKISFAKSDDMGRIDLNDLENLINENTKMIISTLSSNVNGIIMPVSDMGKIAKKHNILFLLDASQGAGCIPVDVEKMNVNLLAAPGHKGLMGPQGTGILYIGDNIKVKSLLEGGTGSKSEYIYQPEILPDMHESGTLNTPGIVGLGAGIEYIKEYGIDKIKKHKNMLINKLYEGIKHLKNIKIYSDINNNSGIMAVNFLGIDPNEVSYVLDKVYDIKVRAGLHCSPMAHDTLGTRDLGGVVRFSVGIFNTEKEIDEVIKAMTDISNNIS